MWRMFLGGSAVEEIYSNHSNEDVRLHFCADTYVTCLPYSSWEHLVQELYDYGEMAVAKEVKAFLQQKGGWLIV